MCFKVWNKKDSQDYVTYKEYRNQVSRYIRIYALYHGTTCSYYIVSMVAPNGCASMYVCCKCVCVRVFSL